MQTSIWHEQGSNPALTDEITRTDLVQIHVEGEKVFVADGSDRAETVERVGVSLLQLLVVLEGGMVDGDDLGLPVEQCVQDEGEECD